MNRCTSRLCLPPSALQAVEAQMRAIEEGRVTLQSPRGLREAALAASQRRRFTEKRAKTKKALPTGEGRAH